MVGQQFPRPRSRRGGEREQLLHARARLVGPAAQPARRRVDVFGEAARDIPRRSILANVGRPAFARRRGAAAADARRPRPHELRELTPLAEVGRQRLGAERRRVGVRARAGVVPPAHLRVRLVGLEADELAVAVGRVRGDARVGDALRTAGELAIPRERRRAVQRADVVRVGRALPRADGRVVERRRRRGGGGGDGAPPAASRLVVAHRFRQVRRRVFFTLLHASVHGGRASAPSAARGGSGGGDGGGGGGGDGGDGGGRTAAAVAAVAAAAGAAAASAGTGLGRRWPGRRR